MDCPKCGLVNPPEAQRCDCGFDFRTHRVRASLVDPRERARLAEHQGQQASFKLDGEILAGEIQSRTALRLIREWAFQHRAEIEANWARMKAGEQLERIEPLE